jgi:CRP-like cAMP-binding protein
MNDIQAWSGRGSRGDPEHVLPAADDACRPAGEDPGNRLLILLPAGERVRLQTRLKRVEFEARARLLTDDRGIATCHFIECGLVSITTPVGLDQRPIEVGVVGRTGMLGISALFGVDAPVHSAEALTPGSALSITASDLREVAMLAPALRDLLFRYAYARLAEVMHISGCNACHSVEQRLVRWILAASDGLASPIIEITHGRLASLLGVRRAGITVALHLLEGEYAIRSTRGRIEIRDRTRLETLSCGCDRLVSKAFASVSSLIAAPGSSAAELDQRHPPLAAG